MINTTAPSMTSNRRRTASVVGVTSAYVVVTLVAVAALWLTRGPGGNTWLFLAPLLLVQLLFLLPIARRNVHAISALAVAVVAAGAAGATLLFFSFLWLLSMVTPEPMESIHRLWGSIWIVTASAPPIALAAASAMVVMAALPKPDSRAILLTGLTATSVLVAATLLNLVLGA